jgi:hypothetical protein
VAGRIRSIETILYDCNTKYKIISAFCECSSEVLSASVLVKCLVQVI